MARNDSTFHGWTLAEWSSQEAVGGDYAPVGQNNGLMNEAADFGDGSADTALVSYAQNSVLNGDFSFSCWINFNTDGGYDGQGVISVGGTAQIGIRSYNGAVNFVIYTDNHAGYSGMQTPDLSLSEYTWTHAVFVKDSATMRIYLNGVEAASADFTGTIIPGAGGPFSATDLLLGSNPWGYPLVGLIDEVGCWQRTLSAAEVSQLYNAGSGLPYEMF